MNHVSNKAKQYGVIALKLLILSLCCMVIFTRISDTEEAVFSSISDKLQYFPSYLWILIPILVILNWSLEIEKWKILASQVSEISFKESMNQSLAALSASLWTPNRVGEYGVKAMFFAPEHRKKILLLKLFGNSAQLLSTLVFGIIGIGILSTSTDLQLSLSKLGVALLGIALLLILGIRYRSKTLIIRGLSIDNVFKYFRSLSLSSKTSVLAISVFRYLVFGSMFLILLMEFGLESSLISTAAFICSVYLLSSVIPSFVLFDVAVKGSVAVWLAAQLGFEPLVVLSVVFVMWLLNFVLPAILGFYFVIRYKPAFE